jgi:GH24 family phage-related lysozyme (muramidase)
MLGYEVVAVYFDQTVAKLKEFEGCVPWMYRDIAGKVTVGVGLMLPNEAAACELPFVMAAGPANLEQIAAEFDRVDALAEGKPPAFYKSATSPELPQRFIDAKLASTLAEYEATLRLKFPIYDKLPDVVKMALLDMAYNLGPARLLTEYPLMLDAIGIGAWSQAAAESAREGIGAARNAWVRQQFLSAVVETIRAGVMAEVKAEARALEDAASAQPGGFASKLRKLLLGK